VRIVQNVIVGRHENRTSWGDMTRMFTAMIVLRRVIISMIVTAMPII
jgi:hypothetical protein